MAQVRILVIEDDPDVRDTVCTALETVFPESNIIALADGREFLEIFDQLPTWSLVIMDLMLPQLSGVEICEKIRKAGAGSQVPVLAMTGYDTPEMEEKIRKAGANDYMAKPFELAEFLQKVRALLKIS